MNWYSRKTKKRIAAVICIILVIAMIAPIVFQYLA